MYPIVVLLLVNHGKTLENTAFMQNTDLNSSSTQPGPVMPVTVTIDIGPNSIHFGNVPGSPTSTISSGRHSQSPHGPSNPPLDYQVSLKNEPYHKLGD